MLYLALVFLFIAQILHFSRHWWRLTSTIREAQRDRRLKDHLNWKVPQRRSRVLAR